MINWLHAFHAPGEGSIPANGDCEGFGRRRSGDSWGAIFRELGGEYRAPTLVLFSGAAGDFPRSYVLAHEVGHHVQHLLGVSGRVHKLRQRVSENEANQLSVRLELQADCFAGLLAHHAARVAGILEPGDIEEALDAASAIGDDTLQRNAGRAVVPDSFTHGSAAQRQRWFRRGFDSGRFADCDTFKETDL